MQYGEINESCKSQNRQWSGAYDEKVQPLQNFTDLRDMAHTFFAKQDFK